MPNRTQDSNEIGELLRHTYDAALPASIEPSIISLMLELSHLSESDAPQRVASAPVARPSLLTAVIGKVARLRPRT